MAGPGGKGLATKKKIFFKTVGKVIVFFDKFVAIFGKKYGSFGPFDARNKQYPL